MTRSTTLLLTSALFLPLAARAQSTPPPATQQPAKPYSSLDNDPQFKRLSPEQQKLVRQMMDGVDKAIADDRKNGAPPKSAHAIPAPPPNAQPATAGCIAPPVKKPKFHLPKTFQDAINKGAKNIGSKTGVDLDPNTPAQTVNDAQKNIGIPCPPTPAQPAPAVKPANK